MVNKFNIKIRTNSEAQKIAMNRPQFIELNWGDTNPHWKGNEISYSSIHAWIGKNKLRPLVCKICGKEGKLELYNKIGKLIRDIDKYQWVHRSCHNKFDKEKNI